MYSAIDLGWFPNEGLSKRLFGPVDSNILIKLQHALRDSNELSNNSKHDFRWQLNPKLCGKLFRWEIRSSFGP